MEFMGIHPVKGDAKGRVNVPKAYRDLLADGGIDELIITTTLNRKFPLIEVVLVSEWQQIVEKLAKEPQFDPVVRDFREIYITPGQSVSLDSAGRILVPPYHRQWGKLDRDVIVTGGTDRFHIWDGTLYQQLIAQTTAEGFDQIQAAIAARLRG
ncbi:MAG: hypothetical protein P9L99_20200 [Candidatus Lernaella stagnicola]|nr:hypothetical protein [Candidatus Lernaella stagnicola]